MLELHTTEDTAALTRHNDVSNCQGSTFATLVGQRRKPRHERHEMAIQANSGEVPQEY